MSRSIVWSRTARETYVEILLAIQEKWGDDLAIKFAEKVSARLEAILTVALYVPFRSQEPQQSHSEMCTIEADFFILQDRERQD